MAEPTPDEPDQFLQSISRSAPHASRWNPQLVEDGAFRICAWPTMESRTWQTRPVDLADVEQVAAHGCYRPEDAARRQAYVEWVGPRILSGRYVGRFAVAADIVLGGAGAILLDWGPTRANPGGLMARIVNVYTEQPYRGRGVATELVQAVMGHCEALGVREFNLGATPQAEALYRSLGFETYVQEMRRRVR